MTICKQLEDLYPAFALDAVDAKEKKLVEEHISTCSPCTNVVDGYRSVVSLLPYTVPMVEPPADLKYRVLQAAMPKTLVEEPQVSIWQKLSMGLNNSLRSPAFAVITLLLVIGLGIWNLSLQNQITQQIASNQQMTSEISRQRALVSTIAYADSQPKHLEPTNAAPQAVGRLFAAPELNAFALIVYDLPVLAPNRVYQIWLIDPNGDRTSGGTFTVDSAGRSWVLIRAPKPLDNYQGIGITAEPAGGSPKPTGPKMMGTSL